MKNEATNNKNQLEEAIKQKQMALKHKPLNLDLLTPKKREDQFETQLLNLMKHKQSPK